MLPGGNANRLWKVADSLGQQLICGDLHRKVPLMDRLGPTFRGTVRQVRAGRGWCQAAACIQDRLPGNRERP